MTLRCLGAAFGALLVIAAGMIDGSAAWGAVLIRTYRVAPAGVDPNGPSGQPSISANSRYLAFASQASNLGPVIGHLHVANIYRFDFRTGLAALISNAPSGASGNGASSTPSISGDGQEVAFVSQASNLVGGTPRHISEIFVRAGTGRVRLVSIGFGGVQPDGDSTQPALSADGRFLAFTSTADNLIAGDDNAASDVFLADLRTGTVQRVSVSSGGAQAHGDSYNPSISADGSLVSFTSAANDLVGGDHNRVPDVFTHDRIHGITRRVSVSSRGREQNAAVPAPFTQISDLSADGRYVVFDSDATNLVSGDTNGHTDVFRRDLATGRTSRVSTSSLQQQGNNDSFAPATSADGRVTVFESFADNLASPWAPNENVFAADQVTGTVLSADVGPQGQARGPELDPELLQRPAVSADGQLLAFTSGANNLVPNDYNGTDDLFVRLISPPVTTIVKAPPSRTGDRRPLVEFRGNNALVNFGLCQLDGRRQMCPAGRPFRLPKLRRGAHVLKISAAAPGTLFDPQAAVVRFTET